MEKKQHPNLRVIQHSKFGIKTEKPIWQRTITLDIMANWVCFLGVVLESEYHSHKEQVPRQHA